MWGLSFHGVGMSVCERGERGIGAGRFWRRSPRGLCPVADLSVGLLGRFCFFSAVVSARVSLVS